ncbi:MAG: 2-C-methyl-D-erythritol 2,4-cyclodiphosphate synthase [Candidatus Rifleibacteriota bacterium]
MTDMRVGLGHDIHALVKERELWLGGVKIPYDYGLKGHSDADALLHAIMDALLGALALGDIGEHFPDTDPTYKNISSAELVKHVVKIVSDKGFSVVNIDCMIHCEKPALKPFKTAMKKSIADLLKINIKRVSVKAGTNEGFDSVGQRKAISCQAVVLLASQ